MFLNGVLQQNDMEWGHLMLPRKTLMLVLYNGSSLFSPLCNFEACPMELFEEIMGSYITKDVKKCHFESSLDSTGPSLEK
ncbi:hypothetical protein IWQ61_002192 [Dispira simplex]|nr:hypothetical protein IWQ61_002192 [Dispira simplex]